MEKIFENSWKHLYVKEKDGKAVEGMADEENKCDRIFRKVGAMAPEDGAGEDESENPDPDLNEADDESMLWADQSDDSEQMIVSVPQEDVAASEVLETATHVDAASSSSPP